MANASRDDNGVHTLIGVLDSDGVTVVPIKANSSTHKLSVINGTSGSNLGPTNAIRDENSVPVLLAVSSSDGTTPVAIYANSAGQLKITTS